jgi:IS5 family transposase
LRTIDSKPQNQKNAFHPLLKEFIDLGHKLVMLAGQIDWNANEDRFRSLY